MKRASKPRSRLSICRANSYKLLWIWASTYPSIISICSCLTIDYDLKVAGVPVRRVPLHKSYPPSAPYALSVTSSIEFSRLYPKANFLATQIWPAARTASLLLERTISPNDKLTVCEFGAGPGLPSITAAKCGAKNVITTDLESFSLELVRAAALEQSLNEIIETRIFDLVTKDNELPKADLYIMTDVFESNAVAIGAARVAFEVIQQGCRVWVFAQQDRAQREVFRGELIRQQSHLAGVSQAPINWMPPEAGPPCSCSLWLCDVDEINVQYG